MIRGLSFFSRTSDPTCRIIASFHSPHNMCWSWCVSFHRFKADERRVRPLWFGFRKNHGFQCGFRIPFIGMITLHRQYNVMPYRDLYLRARDERDHERYQQSMKPPPLPRPSVVDGGTALH